MSDDHYKQLKARTLEYEAAVKNLKIYKARLPEDDGWYFVAAESARMAGKKRPDLGPFVAATHSDLVQIAARSLTGNF